MTSNLTARREAILNIIVAEYIATAAPVASDFILRKYHLGVSSATIRNDMVYLEKEGYIARPHTSAGGIPLDKAYRHYVESIAKDIELPKEEQNKIRRSFNNVEEEIDRWLKLAALMMARFVNNASLVTYPKASQYQLKHLELVSIHEFLALLIVVLREAVLKQQLLSFSEPISQDQLNMISAKLNSQFDGLTCDQISGKRLKSSMEEQRVTNAVLDIMTAEDEMEYHTTYFEGLRLMLEQPEFVKKDSMLRIMELMEEKNWLEPVLRQQGDNEKMQVLIGEESHDKSLKDLSLVLGHYGVPQKARGTIGIIGPTRMDYHKAISTVNYMSDLLSYLLASVHGED